MVSWKSFALQCLLKSNVESVMDVICKEFRTEMKPGPLCPVSFQPWLEEMTAGKKRVCSLKPHRLDLECTVDVTIRRLLCGRNSCACPVNFLSYSMLLVISTKPSHLHLHQHSGLSTETSQETISELYIALEKEAGILGFCKDHVSMHLALATSWTTVLGT